MGSLHYCVVAPEFLRFCAQLTSLDLGCVILNADITPVLEKISEKLEYFSLEETSWINESFGEKVKP
jgi:hypothetical protein